MCKLSDNFLWKIKLLLPIVSSSLVYRARQQEHKKRILELVASASISSDSWDGQIAKSAELLFQRLKLLRVEDERELFDFVGEFGDVNGFHVFNRFNKFGFYNKRWH